jgi:[ribosomal protein S5]-alanine N-acetyltransferase
MNLTLPGGCAVTPYDHRDREAIVANLQDGLVQQWTLLIPFPYTEAHADEWLALAVPKEGAGSDFRNWAIRDATGRQIGGIGFQDAPKGQVHAAELGYWLAAAYWGRGIMTQTVHAVCDFGFQQLGLARITAAAFIGNVGSVRVLEKCGFTLEAPLLRKVYRKDRRFIDAALYAKVQ